MNQIDPETRRVRQGSGICCGAGLDDWLGSPGRKSR